MKKTLLFSVAFIACNAISATYTDEYGTWTYSGGTISAFTPASTVTDVVIPSTIGGNEITALGKNLFYNKTAITSVVLPDNVKTLGEQAFRGCTSLTNVTPFLPESITSIGSMCFNNCSALKIPLKVYPAARFASGESFFRSSGITKADFSESGISVFPKGSFRECPNLGEFLMPLTPTSVQLKSELFYKTSGITNITPFFADNVTSIEGNCFMSCSKLTGDMVFKGALSGSYIFGGTAITAVDFSESNMTSIPGQCFRGCSKLTSVKLPLHGNPISLGNSEIFYSCTALTNVTPLFSENVTAIGGHLFGKCSSLTGDVVFCGTSMSGNAFEGTKVSSFDGSRSTISGLSGAVFNNSKVETVSLPETVTSLNNACLANLKNTLTQIYFRSAMPPSINGFAFSAVNYKCRMYVPISAIEDWATACGANWKEITETELTTFNNTYPDSTEQPIAIWSCAAGKCFVIPWRPPFVGVARGTKILIF